MVSIKIMFVAICAFAGGVCAFSLWYVLRRSFSAATPTQKTAPKGGIVTAAGPAPLPPQERQTDTASSAEYLRERFDALDRSLCALAEREVRTDSALLDEIRAIIQTDLGQISDRLANLEQMLQAGQDRTGAPAGQGKTDDPDPVGHLSGPRVAAAE